MSRKNNTNTNYESDNNWMRFKRKCFIIICVNSNGLAEYLLMKCLKELMHANWFCRFVSEFQSSSGIYMPEKCISTFKWGFRYNWLCYQHCWPKLELCIWASNGQYLSKYSLFHINTHTHTALYHLRKCIICVRNWYRQWKMVRSREWERNENSWNAFAYRNEVEIHLKHPKIIWNTLKIDW